MLRSNTQIINIFQRVLDVVILLLITWLTYKWLGQGPLVRVLAIYGSLLLIILFPLFNVYKSWRGISLFKEVKTLFFSWASVLIVFNVLLLLLSNKEQLAVLWPFCLFKVPVFLLWSLFVFLGLAILRISVKLILLYFRKKGYNQRSAVIVGAGDAGKELAKYLLQNPALGIKVLGFFDDRLSKGEEVIGSSGALGKVLESIDKCPDLILSMNIDLVFIALPMRAEEKINKLIWALGTKGVKVFLVPDLFTLGLQKASMRQIGDLHLLNLDLYPGWKRSFDILFSLSVIIVTIPIWLIIILLIKREDNGSIFYKHPRVTETGKSFNCLKFRTMHKDADKRLESLLEDNPALREEWEKTYKLKDDPRITKIGRFLRKTSLDELPQFLNVLLGQMSVVGARPVVPEELHKFYRRTALTYCSTKPGVTGPWQVGKRSDTEDYDERVALDGWYVLNCSLWLDIKIIIKTILRVIMPKGAY
jgi:putative colanic acid biosynthesis UDP-glucose lipid carrier transferase